jgi:hypothetical protein
MEDIRHESTHALVNLTHPGLPLWLDEGLAEVFEHPDRDKTPDPHRERFLSDINTGFKPDLNRLESMDDVRKFTPRDYREAWAWVEWGLIGPTDSTKAFRSYLDDVMRLGESESVVALKPLSVRWSEANPDMKVPQTAMLAWIGEQKQAADVAAKAPVDKGIKQTRLQNSEFEKQSVETKRSTLTTVRQNQSMLGRFYSSIFGQSK